VRLRETVGPQCQRVIRCVRRDAARAWVMPAAAMHPFRSPRVTHRMTRIRSLPRLARALLVCLPALLARCAPVDVLNATIPLSGLVVDTGVRYGPGPRGLMDVYRPAHPLAAKLPVLVFFYGGAWQNGKRQDYKFVAAELARRGMVVVVPDYRLYPQVQFPVFLQDAAAAVAVVRHSAALWGGDPHRLLLAGHSAGAWIVAMLALDPHWLAAAGDSRDHIAGVAALAGPYDFLPLVGADIKAVFATADGDLRATQPIDFVDGRNPPMLLLAGADDHTVYPRNTIALAARIRAAGGPVADKIYPGLGHVGLVISIAPIFQFRAPVLDDMSRFLLAQPPR
jgi:acetyl esterase/lipase